MVLLADFLMAVGSCFGLYSKFYELYDEDTVISRVSSGISVVSYPFTVFLPFFILDLYFSFFVNLLKYVCWIGIFLYRYE